MVIPNGVDCQYSDPDVARLNSRLKGDMLPLARFTSDGQLRHIESTGQAGGHCVLISSLYGTVASGNLLL